MGFVLYYSNGNVSHFGDDGTETRYDSGDKALAALSDMRSEVDAIPVQACVLPVQDDGGGVLRGGGGLDTAAKMSEDFWSDTTSPNGLPICDHSWGVEKSTLFPDLWICSGCGDVQELNGKGDTPRPVNKTEYDKNWEAVFGPERKHVCRQWVKADDGTLKCYFCGASEEN